MRTIILGEPNDTQKVLIKLLNQVGEKLPMLSSDISYVNLGNGDTIKCLRPNDYDTIGQRCDILYVPSSMTVKEVCYWGAIMSNYYNDIEVVVYRINANSNKKKCIQEENNKRKIQTYL